MTLPVPVLNEPEYAINLPAPILNNIQHLKFHTSMILSITTPVGIVRVQLTGS